MDHVAELVELRHHIVQVVAVLIRRRHLQILHHLLELLQKLPRGILGAVARQVLQPVEHILEVLLAHDPRIAIERPGELLFVLQLRNAAWASEMLPSSMPTAICHSRAVTSRKSSSVLARTSDQNSERRPR